MWQFLPHTFFTSPAYPSSTLTTAIVFSAKLNHGEVKKTARAPSKVIVCPQRLHIQPVFVFSFRNEVTVVQQTVCKVPTTRHAYDACVFVCTKRRNEELFLAGSLFPPCSLCIACVLRHFIAHTLSEIYCLTSV